MSTPQNHPTQNHPTQHDPTQDDPTPTRTDDDVAPNVSGDQRTHTEDPVEGGVPDNADVPREHSEDPAEG